MEPYDTVKQVRDDTERVRNIVDNLDNIDRAVEEVPRLVEETEDLLRRVNHLESEVRGLTEEVNQTTEEVQLRVEVRLEVAAAIAFGALGAERLLAGNQIAGYAFAGLSALFVLAFIETLVKKKRDLGYIVGSLFG